MKTQLSGFTTLVLILCISYTLLSSGCGGAAVSNSPANKPAPNANSNIASNSTANSNSSANTLNTTGANSAPTVLITTETLRTALKARLMHDGLSILNEKDWAKDEWMGLNVGDFYHSNDATAKQKISDTTAEVLRTANKMMTTSAQQRLEDNVSSMTKCKAALELMQNAARDTNTTALVF